MNYQETIQFLYAQLPMFQRIGAAAYKDSLENTWALDKMFGHPHEQFRTVHVAGTNGKGSVSHTLAAVLQCAGYRVGLYTSPHLKDFRERIRVNGQMIAEDDVLDFVARYRQLNESKGVEPSFFELTVTMAFDYFAHAKVDVAVIEVGLGGRLDSTNIICPDLSIITNISFDHTNILGNTLTKIAGEKAGIIKSQIPVVIGEYTDETKPVFDTKVKEMCADVFYAQDICMIGKSDTNQYVIETGEWAGNQFHYALGGDYQAKNLATVLVAVRQLTNSGYAIEELHLRDGLANVNTLTGLQGRWQILGNNPLIVCDTAHNEAGIRYVVEQLKSLRYQKLLVVLGMVSDKSIDHVLALLPREAEYYFTRANIERALDASVLEQMASLYGLHGTSYATVDAAFAAAKSNACINDVVFVGGSTFVVAEVL